MRQHTSASLLKRLHSASMAVIGCTACALRMSAAPISDSPMPLTKPSFTRAYAAKLACNAYFDGIGSVVNSGVCVFWFDHA